MSKIIVIDNGCVQFRAIFAYRANSSVPVTWTYLNMLTGYLRHLGVTLEDNVIIAQDYGSWRKKIDPSYKAQRQGDREEKEDKAWWYARYDEFNALYLKLEQALPFNFAKIYKCESDDIASVACRFFSDKEEIILVSTDKDWEMLCNFPNVKIFSPASKKFKHVPYPMKVLLEKIQGDVSDNLLEKPSSEAEFERRKQIVDLINPLPDNIETPIKEFFMKMLPKNIYLNKIPFATMKEKFRKLYGLK